MIVRPRPTFWQLFFVVRGSVVPRIAPQLLGFSVYAALVVAAMKSLDISLGTYGVAPFALLGVSLSIYLSFRNNAAYDRWWEARRLWGALVYETRNLARSAAGLLPPGSPALAALLKDAAAFSHVLRGDLRQIDVSAAVRALSPGAAEAAAGAVNRPDAVLRRMGRALGDLRARGELDAIGFRILDERLTALAVVQAGCERISTTPLPFAYTLLLHRSAYLFCSLLPIGMAGLAGWATPLFTALLAYSYFGLDALSEELEDPFGLEANDLPLDGLCRVIEISVAEALGEPPPPALEVSRFYAS